MSNDLKHTIYNPTDCLSEKMLFDYIDNKLSQKERHIVEKHLLDCEMCSDALEGLEMVKDRNRIVLIKDAINKKILSSTKKEAVVVSFNYKMAFSIAATVALLIVGVFFFKNIGLKESSMSDMAELTKEESAPPPPPAPPLDGSGKIVTESEELSGPTVTGVQSESNGLTSSKIVDQEIALAEEQKQDYYKSAEGSGETRNQEAPVEATGNATVSNDATIAKPNDDRKNNELETVSIPKTSASEREKDAKLEDKKAVEKTVTTGSNGGTFAWNTTPDQKQKNTSDNTKKSGDQVDLAKKTESGGKYRSESKEKGKRDKEPSKVFSKDTRSDENKNVGGVVSAPQSVAQDLDELKSEEVANTSTTKTVADSISEQVYTVVEQMPEYPGGIDSMMKFISKNFRPAKVIDPETGISSTKMYVQFTVRKDGSISNPKITKGISPALDKEAIRVVKMMPKWKPGKQYGVPVNVTYNLPIQLEIK